MISFEDAWQHILSALPKGREEQVFIADALGRVLMEDLCADRDHPPWDNTAVDGFAVHATDTVGASKETPCTLQLDGVLAAGDMWDEPVQPGHALRIMTGAPMPPGANAVVMVEDTQSDDQQVQIYCPADLQENIRPRGEDVTAGSAVLTSGTTLRPAHLGMAASLGRSVVRVTRRPTVAILSTGDEIAEIDAPLSDRQIRDVNSHALAAQVVDTGAIPLRLGVAKDTPEAIHDGIAAGLDCDVLLISGGVSMGDFDYVKGVMQQLGGGLDFWKVRIKPARPLAFGTIAGVPTFGLPGNPVSSMVSYELFVRPFLNRLMGHSRPDAMTLQATLTEPIHKRAGRRFFLRGVLTRQGDQWHCRTTGPQGSGMLTSMVQADVLIDLPETLEGPVEAGSTVTVRLL